VYYTEALETHRRVQGDEHPHTITSIKSLIALYHSWGKPTK